MNFKHTGGNCYEPKQTNLANIENQKHSLEGQNKWMITEV